MDYKVTKCICFDTTLAEMKKIMEENNIHTLEELQKIKRVGDNCRICVPYIERMIQTGETEIDILLNN